MFDVDDSAIHHLLHDEYVSLEAVTCSANVYTCNFAIYRNEYSKQYPDAKAMRETTERSGYNASNDITRVKLGGAHGLTWERY